MELPLDPPGRYVGKIVRLRRNGEFVDVFVYRHGYGCYYNGRWRDASGKIHAGIVEYAELQEAATAGLINGGRYDY